MAVLDQQSPSKTWRIDRVHSNATFEVRHSGVSLFRGTFGDLDATLRFVEGEPELTGSVRVASVQVPDETLTGHLLSPDFFDAERYPEIRFTSTRVQRGDGNSITVEGDLSIKGHTKQVTAEGSISYVEADIAGSERYGVELGTTIDRTSFGVDWNSELPGGGLVVGNDVKLVVHLEFAPEG
jgi:polyisoprenoid-binding protein YceI